MHAQSRTNSEDFAELELVPAPATQQVAPPMGARIPLALSVFVNVLVGSLLLGCLLLAPVVLAGWLMH